MSKKEQNLQSLQTDVSGSLPTDKHLKFAECCFSYEELQYVLVMLTEGQNKINKKKTFERFQNYKIQETIIDKIREKCWECHQK